MEPGDSNEFSQKQSIQHLATEVMKRSLMDTEEIYYYTGGIYRPGGEQIIKITLEEIAGYSINGHKRRENHRPHKIQNDDQTRRF